MADSSRVSVLQVRAARTAGRLAAAAGLPIEACPYKPGEDGAVTPLMRAFVYGYNSRKRQDQQQGRR
ncbi:Rmf/CrpP family protein [Thermobispora bispora]|uniref:Rmf/CrpP family protein n=1 Tax=Thermobispora bispora TaxID=2006 RepID=UPI0019819751|nr:Rmf/CrpP family protein [Thermobispora bispora]QSI49939.1 hypothetical protein CYL17_18330 [Thermobispora bispora]QSI50041.1 hypothetical protein CYL17_18900 [Thermobispora bispora]